MSLNCQSASKSELERREEGRLVLVGPGSDANLRALIRVSAPPGTPEHAIRIADRSGVYGHRFVLRWWRIVKRGQALVERAGAQPASQPCSLLGPDGRVLTDQMRQVQ